MRAGAVLLASLAATAGLVLAVRPGHAPACFRILALLLKDHLIEPQRLFQELAPDLPRHGLLTGHRLRAARALPPPAAPEFSRSWCRAPPEGARTSPARRLAIHPYIRPVAKARAQGGR